MRHRTGPRLYLSHAVEVIDVVVVILSIVNACTNKIINLNMVRMVRWPPQPSRRRKLLSCPAFVANLLVPRPVHSIICILGRNL